MGIFDNRFCNAGNIKKINSYRISPVVCYASDKVEKSFIPPPAEFLLKGGGAKKSDIIVSYSLFPSDAKAAFEYAVGIWETIIESDIPIYIQANWRTMDTNVLGSAGPTDYYSNFKNAPHKNRFYPVSVYEKITKTQVTGAASPDINATFNKDVKWYFGTDGKTPELLYDFVTVVLHEIGHGLGFTGFFYVAGSMGAYGNDNAGDASAFDYMVVNDQNKLLTDTSVFKMPSSKLFSALTSNGLYINSPAAKTVNTGSLPRLYAPSTYNDGSSIYHLNDATYPSSNENTLMTHTIGKGEAVHDPGPITKGILADIGWKLMKLEFNKPKDIEENKPIVFSLSIESDFALDTNSVLVIYSTDSFKQKFDTLVMVENNETGLYTVELIPVTTPGTINYFISVRDVMNRTFTVPSKAPAETNSVSIGPDITAPIIEHTPIQYFVSFGNNIKISTNADDNLGIDSVYVEYSVNNVPMEPFGLSADSINRYSGFFNTNASLLNDGDVIKYKIIAMDSSKSRNKSISPAESSYSFRVEKIFNPIGGYVSDFNNPTPDFVIYDFNIYTVNGFQNGSLNSKHPYPSPNKENTNFNFVTILKYPIILKENGTMSFDEIVLVEPGETFSKYGDENFWDYVIVEGSKDKGKTWLPLVNGYDSGANSTWKTNYNKKVDKNQVSLTIGVPEWYIKREIKLLGNGNFKARDTILIRFRLFSDPFAHGWGWSIDNLRIQTPVSVNPTVLSPGNINVYPNPFNDVLNIDVQVNNNVEDLAIELLNSYGQKVTSIQDKNVSGELKTSTDLSTLRPGMYFVVVKENGKQVFSGKIIKNQAP